MDGTREHKGELALVAALLVGYVMLSVRREQTLLSGGYDLGIFTQIVKDWAHLRLPTVHLVDDSRLAAGHFSPALALLGVPYRVLPSPVTLLVVQSALISSAVLPIKRWAREILGARQAWLVSVLYGLSPGIIGTAWWDFHEVALAVPLVSCSMVALARGRWRAAAWWAVPLVLVKEDLGLTVAAIGLFIAVRGSRRLGLGLAAFGVAATLVELKVLLPALPGGHGYFYTSALMGDGVGGMMSSAVQDVPVKLLMVLALLAPSGLLALRSPFALVALPTLGWRLLYDVHYFHLPSTQYDAVLVPVLAVAAIDAWSRMGPGDARRRWQQAAVGMTAVWLLLGHATALATPSFWRTSARVHAAHRILAEIPDGAAVAASNQLVPPLVSRTTTYYFGADVTTLKTIQPSDWRRATWIVVDTSPDHVSRALVREFRALIGHGYVLVDSQDGVELIRKVDATS